MTCADIIREAVDPTDYKGFILPLVYHKSISDEFEKQYVDALDDDRLGRLVEHLSKYDLDRDSVPPDMLGEAYMDLVRHFAEEQGGDPTKMTFTGQEVNPDIAAIAKMNLSIHGLDGEIQREDSLSNPAFTNSHTFEKRITTTCSGRSSSSVISNTKPTPSSPKNTALS
nr:N-6 DNA methylase [Halorubrum amylolyticum]